MPHHRSKWQGSLRLYFPQQKMKAYQLTKVASVSSCPKEAMMIIRIVSALVVGIILTFSFVNVTWSAVKKAGGAATPTMTRAMALTEGECTGLGGKVSAANKCANGGLGCYTTDKDGVIHM